MGRVSQGEIGVISNNNFYGKKSGKTIRDFTVGLNYDLDNVQDRIDFLNSKLEVSKVGDVEFAHDYFIELFDQTFDDSTGINTSSIKLILNSDDAQYSESNIANELSKLADYILAKDKKDTKEKIKIYNEEDFKKRLYSEKNKLEPLQEVNGDEFIVLKRFENYRLAPKMVIDKSDYELPLVYKGTYEDYLHHWNSHQYKNIYTDGKFEKVYLDKEDFKNISTSVCMSKEEWQKGKENILDKIELLKVAESNRQVFNNIKNESIAGKGLNGIPLRSVTTNIKDINDYMLLVKNSYHNYVSIKPDKCPSSIDIMNIVDYSNEKHVAELISYQGSKNDLNNDIAILLQDIDNAIEVAKERNLMDEDESDIVRFLRQGKTKEWISKKKNISRMTVHRKLKKTTATIVSILHGK